MKIDICSFCGGRLDLTEKDAKDYRYYKSKKGYFTCNHVQAIVDKKGKVIDHLWNDPIFACPDCTEKIDLAIQTAAGEIALANPKSRTIKVKAPYINTEPIEGETGRCER